MLIWLKYEGAGVSSKSMYLRSWHPVAREIPAAVGMLILALMLASCDDSSVSMRSSVTIVHEDVSGLIPLEGALTRVAVLSPDREILYESVVNYPSRPEAIGEPRRYDLVSAADLPIGIVTIKFEILPCTFGCPDIAQVSELPEFEGNAVCELSIDVAEGADQEFTIVTPDDTESCRLA